MQSFQGTFETCMQSFVSAFSIYMTVPLRRHLLHQGKTYPTGYQPKIGATNPGFKLKLAPFQDLNTNPGCRPKFKIYIGC